MSAAGQVPAQAADSNSNSDSAKVAIVTGAGGMRGIGRGIALRLARDGYDVTLVDIKRPESQMPPDELLAGWQGVASVADEVRGLGRRALLSYTDVTRSDAVQAMLEDTLHSLGRIDVLVNNARAIIGGRDHVVQLEESEWDRIIAVNLKGTFLCCRAVARYFLKERRRGRIINIGSMAGKRGTPGDSAYCSSKFAVAGFTQSLALELASAGITVNSVCPGLVDSGRFSQWGTAAAEKAGVTFDEFERSRIEQRSKMVPLGRAATPEDVAAMVAFLVSDEARHVTGQSINVNGGEIMI